MIIDCRERGRRKWRGEKERGEKRERKRNMDWLPLVHTPTRDGTRNPSMCPDWVSNPHPFSVWNDASLSE